jgi:opacity protein-like surface antigen
MVKYALTAALVLGFAGAAFAADGSQFVIIKDKNKNCRIIEQNLVSEDQLTMQIGKQGYPSREEANIDVKVLCNTP